MPFLELRNVSKSFGTRQILKNINLTIEKGEFVSIVGYSGSGKTTLISLIAGLLKPDEGEILLDGVPVTDPGPDRGIIFQNYSLLPWMTSLENVTLAVDAAEPDLSPKEKRDRAEYFLHLVRLKEAQQKLPHQLSGGMRQRVAVARGLATDPKVLLLDEPFSALDALTRSSLQKELSRIWSEHKKTVVMITNDIDEAILLADRIYPLTMGPAATLGDEIPVEIAHPRSHRHLSLNPNYQRSQREIIHFLTQQKQGVKSMGSAISNGTLEVCHG